MLEGQAVGRHLVRHASALQHHDAVAESEHLGRVGRDDDDGGSGCRELGQQAIDLLLRADVDADRRLVEHDDAGAGGEAAAQHDLLLVTAAEQTRLHAGVARADVEALRQLRRAVAGRRVVEESRAGALGERRQREVALGREVEHDAVVTPVTRHEHDTRLEGRGGARRAEAAARERQVARVTVQAHQGLGQLGGAGAEQPGDAEDLAGAHVEVDTVHDRPDAQAAAAQHRFGRGGGAAGGVEVVDLAPDHQADHLAAAIGVDGVDASDVETAAQDRHPVADAGDLAEVVRDVQARDAAVAQAPDDAEQLLRLGAGERGGGLVEDDEARVVVDERPGHLHELALGGPEVAHETGRREPDAEHVVQHLGHPGLHAASSQHAARALLVAEPDVLGDRHVGHELEFLVHEADAGRVRIGGCQRAGIRAADDHRARIARIDAREDLDERGLARAVLADEAVHLARAHVDRGAPQSRDARERLRDAGHVQDRRHEGGGAVRHWV